MLKQRGDMEAKVLTIAPAAYEDLIRRFIWRHTTMLIIRHNMQHPEYSGPVFTMDMTRAFYRNFYYGNDVFSRSAAAFREAATAQPQGRVRLFDIYMLQECYVGRHEPAAVVQWQNENPNLNLRCANALEAGAFSLSRSGITIDEVVFADWSRNKIMIGASWEGEVHRWTVNDSVSDMMVQRLVEQACKLYQDWYDHPYPQYTDRQRYYSGGESICSMEMTLMLSPSITRCAPCFGR